MAEQLARAALQDFRYDDGGMVYGKVQGGGISLQFDDIGQRGMEIEPSEALI